MWIFRQPGPGQFVREEVPAPAVDDLPSGHVLVRFRAGAICGSDLPKYAGIADPDNPYTGQPGVPLHEVVCDVVASRDPSLTAGQRVVGIMAQSRGLSEMAVNPAAFMIPVDGDFTDAHATVIQPMATVLSALSNVPDLAGRRVLVLGLGPLGLLFCHVAKSRGAAWVAGVDRVDRTDVASSFGIDEAITSEIRSWGVNHGSSEGPFDVVIDAIGHRQEIITDAVDAAAQNGHVIVFGLPEDFYVFPMRSFFRKNLTLTAGATIDWQFYLRSAQDYLLHHRKLAEVYVTNEFPISEVESAFRCYAMPKKSRLKVILVPD